MKQKSIRRTKKRMKQNFQIGNIIYNTSSYQCATITNVSKISVGNKVTQISMSLMNSVDMFSGKYKDWNFNGNCCSIRLANKREIRRYYSILVKLSNSK